MWKKLGGGEEAHSFSFTQAPGCATQLPAMQLTCRTRSTSKQSVSEDSSRKGPVFPKTQDLRQVEVALKAVNVKLAAMHSHVSKRCPAEAAGTTA